MQIYKIKYEGTIQRQNNTTMEQFKYILKLEKKYAPAFDNYGQSCFVRSDFFK